MDTVDNFLIYMPMYGGFLLAMFDCRRMYCTSVYVPMSSTLGQTIFTRAEDCWSAGRSRSGHSDKTGGGDKMDRHSCSEIGPEVGETFFVASWMGTIVLNFQNYLIIFSDFLGELRGWQMGMSAKKSWDTHNTEIEGPKYMGMWTRSIMDMFTQQEKEPHQFSLLEQTIQTHPHTHTPSGQPIWHWNIFDLNP